MTELLLGTKKGLFVLEGDPADGFEITARAFAGEPVDYAIRDPRSGRLLATMTSPFYGPKIFFADDPNGDWKQAEGVSLPEGGGAHLGHGLRRGRRGAVCRGRPRGPVRKLGRRRHLVDQRGAVVTAQPG